jgi:hypothetical protein
MGKYEPQTWKELFKLAPSENTPESIEYLELLKREVFKNFAGKS